MKQAKLHHLPVELQNLVMPLKAKLINEGVEWIIKR